MAKRSDFAQKLLDDLQMRKEKMGMAAASGRRTGQPPSASNDQWSLRGSRQAATNSFRCKNVVNTDATKIWLGTRHNKTLAYEGSSQDIIPIRRAAHVGQTVDVSVALALALSNSGKLQNIEFISNATNGKEHIMHRGLLNFKEKDGRSISGRPRHPNDQLHLFSNMEIDEVSKGVQQINKILKACSNGLSFSQDAVDIGRELLRGARDLEESLRMLANLQEASDYLVGTQGKVRLLKGKEDESSNHEGKQKKLMNRPKFSFDKPGRNTYNIDRNSDDPSFLDQNKLALSFLEKPKTPISNFSKSPSNITTKFISHNTSLSHDPSPVSDEQISGFTTNSSQTKVPSSFKYESGSSSTTKIIKQKAMPVGEKVRIPNVVAKLMGLEQLPLPNAAVKNCETQKILVTTKATDLDKILVTDAKNVQSKKEAGAKTCSEKSLSRMDDQKKVQEKNITERKSVNTTESVLSKGKTKVKDQNDRENTHSAIKHSPHLKINNKSMKKTNIHQMKETRDPNRKEVESGEAINIMEKTSKEKLRRSVHNAEKPFTEHLQEFTTSLAQKIQNDAISRHELAPQKKEKLLDRKRNVKEVSTITSNRPIPAKNKLLQRQPMVPRLKIEYTDNRSLTGKEHHEINKTHVTIERKGYQKLNLRKFSHDTGTRVVLSESSTIDATKGSSTNTIDKEPSKEYFEIAHQEKQQTDDRRIIYPEVDRNVEDRNSQEGRPLKMEPITEKEKVTTLLLEAATEKPSHTSSVQKEKKAEVIDFNNQNSNNSEEDPRRMETQPANHQPLKDQTSILHKLEHRWKERTRKEEGNAFNSCEINWKEHLQQKDPATIISCNHLTHDCRKTTLADQSLATKTNNPDITIEEPAAHQPPEFFLKDDAKQEVVLKENMSEGPSGRMQHSNSTKWQNQTIPQVDGHVSLTKNEHLLKKILMNSQHFLNTAQAVFRLKIPVGVLQASENVCPNESSRIVLDCGYEIMRRKGKREEIHFVKSMYTAPVKARCLDSLVREMNDDLEKLKLPGKVEGGDDDIAECLYKLLQRDIQSRNPDVNCMWDFGWNNTTFADTERDEVIRYLEKHVLNGLINELARDLLKAGMTT